MKQINSNAPVIPSISDILNCHYNSVSGVGMQPDKRAHTQMMNQMGLFNTVNSPGDGDSTGGTNIVNKNATSYRPHHDKSVRQRSC